MPNRTETLENPVWGMTKFMYSWGALKMLSTGATKGYYMPVPGYRLLRKPFAKMGIGAAGKRGLGWFGAATTRSTYGTAQAMSFGAARRALFTKGTDQALRGVASKVIIGKVAGVALTAANIYLWGGLAVGAAWGGYDAIRQYVRRTRGLELGGYFPETQRSATSRQRAVRAISESQLQARSAIGNEAMLFHR